MVLSRIHKIFTFSDRVKDWVANAIIAVVIAGLLVGFTLFGVQLSENAALTQKSITSSNLHHSETQALEDQIKALLNEHSTLLQSVADEQKALAAAENAITADGNYIVEWQTWAANIIGPLCAVTNGNGSASCPPPPAPPTTNSANTAG